MATSLVKHAKLFCRLHTEIYSSNVIFESIKPLRKICHNYPCPVSVNQTLAIRKFSSHAKLEHGEEPVLRPSWKLMGAVCLERPPIVATEMNAIEQNYKDMVQSLEFENSVLSDHEIQLKSERQKMEQKQRGEIDEDEDSGNLLTAQDIEDLAAEELNKFTTANITTEADKIGDKSTSHRKLSENLILLIRKDVGKQKVWMLPHMEHVEGESLRQTAERAALQVGSGAKVTFFGNAPIGFYKYKFPKEVKVQTGAIGAKVFFFRAKVLQGQVSIHKEAVDEHVWVSKEEMKDYLVPAYLESLLKFIRTLLAAMHYNENCGRMVNL
ncbi:39S ribosomal protein L46, mitochondrial-like isoform X2 [Anneissia japonica]|nr:39S ribosomal protein L46, mitochondrial-like isoform X2 [Anneissia japonica]